MRLPTDSWALIFEPRDLEKLRGRVSVLNSHRELIGAALRYLGYSAQERDPHRWKQAKNLIVRAKPSWATFSNSTYIKELAQLFKARSRMLTILLHAARLRTR